jgi:iron complex transport system substrate-binding protein
MTWTEAALGDAEPEIFNVDDGFPFETIARLDPDVILAVNTYPYIADHWDELNGIAPVVAHVGDPFIDSWDSGVRQVAAALGRAAEGEQLIADIESSIDESRSAHPEFAGKTVSFFNYMGPDGLWVISSEADFCIKFLVELGFSGVTDAVTETAGERRFQVSRERFTDLEADLVMGTSTVGPELLEELAAHPIFAQLPAIDRGAYIPFYVGDSTSMVQPSALSLPFALDQLVPHGRGDRRLVTPRSGPSRRAARW